MTTTAQPQEGSYQVAKASGGWLTTAVDLWHAAASKATFTRGTRLTRVSWCTKGTRSRLHMYMTSQILLHTLNTLVMPIIDEVRQVPFHTMGL